ncbi:hypothetical protein QFZ79_004310 [Arthrobacter sp. V4I6]|uniref:hypothetical protein n=1 Tax=unclassified Arthrobacter TaxID=235627 RepID=UPI002786D692|nr:MULTISPECIES: hypothetical protein [unclassified Arthrobacter]MDQ0821933.1 hypothetical protein [Arthrobacter sp. V1I7]MDQ0856199.1 hypothetical protein [Arthrobacter sp. V4I6]
MSETASEFQPKDLDTRERLATAGRAVAQGIRYKARGEHETQRGADLVVDEADVAALIEEWPEAQKKVAEQMLAKYGPPNEATPTRLTWHRNGPWKRTEITSDAVVHNWPTVHTDFLTQTIDYRVPPPMIGAVAEFDGSITVDRTRGEVSARCDSEAANVLGLNMVHELVTGKRDVAGARHTSEQNTVGYSLGREAPYAERLLFEIPQGGTEDLDESSIGEAATQQLAGKGQRHRGTPGRAHRAAEWELTTKQFFGAPPTITPLSAAEWWRLQRS